MSFSLLQERPGVAVCRRALNLMEGKEEGGMAAVMAAWAEEEDSNQIDR